MELWSRDIPIFKHEAEIVLNDNFHNEQDHRAFLMIIFYVGLRNFSWFWHLEDRVATRRPLLLDGTRSALFLEFDDKSIF